MFRLKETSNRNHQTITLNSNLLLLSFHVEKVFRNTNLGHSLGYSLLKLANTECFHKETTSLIFFSSVFPFPSPQKSPIKQIQMRSLSGGTPFMTHIFIVSSTVRHVTPAIIHKKIYSEAPLKKKIPHRHKSLSCSYFVVRMEVIYSPVSKVQRIPQFRIKDLCLLVTLCTDKKFHTNRAAIMFLFLAPQTVMLLQILNCL